jgi:hypothetical protein
VDDRVSLLPFGFTISLPDLLSVLISLSLPIPFLVGQWKTRKINERKKEEKDKKVPVAKKKEEWCICFFKKKYVLENGVGAGGWSSGTAQGLCKRNKRKVGFFSF